MKKLTSLLVLLSILSITAFVNVRTASAEDVKSIGILTKIQLSADGKSATAVLKDNKSGESFTITITDDLTLDKFKDKRIVEGDEIRTKFEKSGDVNKSKIFKKTAGC